MSAWRAALRIALRTAAFAVTSPSNVNTPYAWSAVGAELNFTVSPSTSMSALVTWTLSPGSRRSVPSGTFSASTVSCVGVPTRERVAPLVTISSVAK